MKNLGFHFSLRKIFYFLFKNDLYFVVCFLLLTLVLFLSTDLSQYHLGHNDGSSYICSFFDWKLFHFGAEDIVACTYDHQPIYFFFLKLMRNMWERDLNLIRWSHQIFWIGSGVYIYKIGKSENLNRFSSFLVAVAFLTSPMVLDLTIQLRMYTFYLLTCLILYYHRLTLRWKNISTKIVAVIAYLNFIFILLPLSLWFFEDLKHTLNRFSYLKKVFKNYWIVCFLVFMKIVFVMYHRVGRRAWPGDLWYESYNFSRHFQEMFNSILGASVDESWSKITITTTLQTVMLIIFVVHAFFAGKRHIKDLITFCLFSYLTVLVLRFVFKIEEIEYRYILYVTPLLYIAGLSGLKDKPKVFTTFFSFYLLTIIAINYSSRSFFNFGLSPFKNEIKKLHDFINHNKIQYVFTFSEQRDVNYLMSYIHLFWEKNVPLIRPNLYVAPKYLAGTNYFLIEVAPHAPDEERFFQMINTINGKAEKMFCLDIYYPNVCLFRVQGDPIFDHLSEDEINMLVVPQRLPNS